MKSIHEMHDAIGDAVNGIGDAVNGAADAVYNYHLTSKDLNGILAIVFGVFIIWVFFALIAAIAAYDGAAEHARRSEVVKAILDAENARRRARNQRLRAWAAGLIAVQPNGK